MNLDKIKANDRVIARIPSDEKGGKPAEHEVTVLRVAANKSAVVVKMDDGIMKTLPIVNVLSYAGEKPAEKPAAPAEKKEEPAQVPGHETNEGIVDLNEKAAEEEEAPLIAPEQPAEVPVSESAIQDQLDKISKEKGEKPIVEPTREEKLKAGEAIATDMGAKKDLKKEVKERQKQEKKSAAEVMEAADQMSQEATEKLNQLKGKKAEQKTNEGVVIASESVKKILALECKKHIKMFKLKAEGYSNKQIADMLETNAGHVWNALKKYEEKPELKAEADKI